MFTFHKYIARDHPLIAVSPVPADLPPHMAHRVKAGPAQAAVCSDGILSFFFSGNHLPDTGFRVPFPSRTYIDHIEQFFHLPMLFVPLYFTLLLFRLRPLLCCPRLFLQPFSMFFLNLSLLQSGAWLRRPPIPPARLYLMLCRAPSRPCAPASWFFLRSLLPGLFTLLLAFLHCVPFFVPFTLFFS